VETRWGYLSNTKPDDLERKYQHHDKAIAAMLAAIRELMNPLTHKAPAHCLHGKGRLTRNSRRLGVYTDAYSIARPR
jgi:hypothetical protein